MFHLDRVDLGRVVAPQEFRQLDTKAVSATPHILQTPRWAPDETPRCRVYYPGYGYGPIY